MLTLPAHIARITTLADGSWRMVVDLGELEGERLAEVAKLANKVVCLAVTLGEEFTSEEREVLDSIKIEESEEGGW